MVRYLLLLILILLSDCQVTGQPRHVSGMNMLGISAGLGNNALLIGGIYQKYYSGYFSGRLSLSLDQVNYKLSSYHAYYLSPAVQYSLLTNKRNLYLNAQGGLIGGIEHISSAIFNQRINNLYLGESIGAAFEYFISSFLKIELEFEQRFFQASKISNYRYFFLLGTYVKI